MVYLKDLLDLQKEERKKIFAISTAFISAVDNKPNGLKDLSLLLRNYKYGSTNNPYFKIHRPEEIEKFQNMEAARNNNKDFDAKCKTFLYVGGTIGLFAAIAENFYERERQSFKQEQSWQQTLRKRLPNN